MSEPHNSKATSAFVGLISGFAAAAATLSASGVYVGQLDQRVKTLEFEMREMRPVIWDIHQSVIRTEQSVADVRRRLDKVEQ